MPPAAKRVNRRARTVAQLDAERSELIEALGALEDLSGTAKSIREALEELGEFEAALDLFGRLDDTRRLVQWMMDEVGKACIGMAPDRFAEYPVPGGGMFKIGGGRQRKSYDNEGLVREAALRIAEVLRLKTIVTADGEPGEPVPLVTGIVSKVAALVGATAPSFDGWRSGVAKELGIDLKAYAETEETPLRPRLEGRGMV